MTDSTPPIPDSKTLSKQNRHRKKAMARDTHHERLKENSQIQRGIMIVHTGKGKGKSTAAIGMMVRSAAHGFHVALAQFIKGPKPSGERELFAKMDYPITIHAKGEGFTWKTQDRDRDVAATRETWNAAVRWLSDPTYRLVVLDEINVVLNYGHIDAPEVLNVLANRPRQQNVVLTGRNALSEVIEAADLVTEMSLIKHPFRAGIQAQAGIEF